MSSPTLSKKKALERIFVFQAVEYGYLTQEQLIECIEEHDRSEPPVPLLTICKQKGYLTSSQVNHLMSKRLDSNVARAFAEEFTSRPDKTKKTDIRPLEPTAPIPRMMADDEKQEYERLLAEKDRLLEREQKQRQFLKRRLEEYEAKVKKHEQEKHDMRGAKQREIEALESELTCYKGLHQQSDQQSRAYYEQMQNVTKVLEREKQKSKSFFNLVEESGRELRVSEENRRKAEANLEKEKRELEYLRGKLERETGEKLKWKESSENAEENNLKIQKELEKLKEDYLKVETAQKEQEQEAQSVQKKKEELEATLDSLYGKLSEQKERTQTLEAEIREADETPNEKALKDEIQKLKEELEALENQSKESQNQLDKLKEEKESLQAEFDALKNEKEDLDEKSRQEIRSLQEQFEKEKQELEEKFHKLKISLETDLSASMRKSEELEAKLQQYQESLKHLDEQEKEKEELKKKIANEKKELEEQIELEREKRKNAEQNKFMLEDKIKNAEQQMDRFRQIYVEGELKEGTTLLGSRGEFYTIQKILGHGGMGVAYIAKRGSDNMDVVVKTLQPEGMAKMKELMRFVQEARTILGFEHENLVKGFDFYQGREMCYFIMEYLDGDSVEDMLEEQGLLDTIEATRIVLGVAKALQYLEENHLVHRDVKPANIILSSAGVAKLVDFGIVKMTDRTCSLTTEGIILGTPYYLSPEQTYQTNVDIRSDIYSLGATYYHMVVGEVPFPGDNPIDVIQKRLVRSPKPCKVKPDLPRQVGNIIEKMMNKNAKKRHNTVTELVEEMEIVLDKISG